MSKKAEVNRQAFIERYNNDPAFRLKRLLMLRTRHFKRRGGIYPNDRAYELEIAEAGRALKEQEPTT